MDAQHSDEEAAAMALTMGFSAFGGPKKSHRPQHLKRRYDEFSSAAAARPDRYGTGANAVCLPSQPTKPSEIALEDDDDAPNPQASTPAEIIISQPAPPSLPARPGPGTGFVGSFPSRDATPTDPARSHHHHRSHQSSYNPLWYEGYYDPSSNENPWQRLEEATGLEPLGPRPSLHVDDMYRKGGEEPAGGYQNAP